MRITTGTGERVTVTFAWDLRPERYKELYIPTNYCENNYYGAVFFGNFKLEFIRDDTPGGYRNLYQYGVEHAAGHAYDYLEDGTPYELLDDDIILPDRRTFRSFARAVERRICDLLLRNPEYIPAATVPTNPQQWYPDGRPTPAKGLEITRLA